MMKERVAGWTAVLMCALVVMCFMKVYLFA